MNHDLRGMTVAAPGRARLASTAALTHEHELIRMALSVLRAMSSRLAAGGDVPRARVLELLSFLERFADCCHHAKEEGILFPALEAAGVPRRGGPIGIMLSEHERGRALLRSLRETAAGLGVSRVRDQFRIAAREYGDLFTAHITKEDDDLFRIAERYIAGEQDAAIAAAFTRYENQAMQTGEHEHWQRIVEGLARDFLAPAP
jgi:hemerythrin-like domain-containing protein